MRRVHIPALLFCGLSINCTSVTSVPPSSLPIHQFAPYQLAPQSVPQADSSPTRGAKLKIPSEANDFSKDNVYASLVRFANEQRHFRETTPSQQSMPARVRKNWFFAIRMVDNYLSSNQVDLLDLIRTRLSLESELQLDQEHYRALPEALWASVKARTLALYSRQQEIQEEFATSSASVQLLWPLQPIVVTSLFGLRTDPFDNKEKLHQGIDLKAFAGQSILAAAEGVVEHAGWNGGHGLQVRLIHEDGLMTAYSHLSKIFVSVGDNLPKQGLIGLAGTTGRSTGPHLHFEVWRNGRSVDPLLELPSAIFNDH